MSVNTLEESSSDLKKSLFFKKYKNATICLAVIRRFNTVRLLFWTMTRFMLSSSKMCQRKRGLVSNAELHQPGRQCRPRVEKVFPSSSWTFHRVSKQTLPGLTGLNKEGLAAGTRSSRLRCSCGFLPTWRG